MYLHCYKINISYISDGRYEKIITDLNGNVYPSGCEKCGFPETIHKTYFWGDSHSYETPNKTTVIARMISNRKAK